MSLRIQSECGKIRTRKTPNTNTFHVMTVVVATLSCKKVIRRTQKMSIFSLGTSKSRKMVLALTDDYYLSWKGLKKALISSSTVSQDKAVL